MKNKAYNKSNIFDTSKLILIDEVLYTKYDMLARICNLIDNNKLNDAKNLLELTRYLYKEEDNKSNSFFILCNSIRYLIAYEENSKDELYYQSIFKLHCKEILGDEYVLYDMKNLKPKRPDAWVENKGNIIPVEMKRYAFDRSALKQLLKYMKMYNCNYGIAIGSELSIKLPLNITFVNLTKVKEYDI